MWAYAGGIRYNDAALIITTLIAFCSVLFFILVNVVLWRLAVLPAIELQKDANRHHIEDRISFRQHCSFRHASKSYSSSIYNYTRPVVKIEHLEHSKIVMTYTLTRSLHRNVTHYQCVPTLQQTPFRLVSVFRPILRDRGRESLQLLRLRRRLLRSLPK